MTINSNARTTRRAQPARSALGGSEVATVAPSGMRGPAVGRDKHAPSEKPSGSDDQWHHRSWEKRSRQRDDDSQSNGYVAANAVRLHPDTTICQSSGCPDAEDNV